MPAKNSAQKRLRAATAKEVGQWVPVEETIAARENLTLVSDATRRRKNRKTKLRHYQTNMPLDAHFVSGEIYRVNLMLAGLGRAVKSNN